VSVLHFPGIDRMAKRTMTLPAEPRLTIEDVPEDALSGLDTALSPKNRASGATVVCLFSTGAFSVIVTHLWRDDSVSHFSFGDTLRRPSVHSRHYLTC
jgi:hypothetical protein